MNKIIAVLAIVVVCIICASIFIVDISAHEVLVISDELLAELSPAHADSILKAYNEQNNILLTDYFFNHKPMYILSSLPKLTTCSALDNIKQSGVCCIPAIESFISYYCSGEDYVANFETMYVLQLLIDEAVKINCRYKPYPCDAAVALQVWNNYKSSIPETVDKIIFGDEDNIQLIKYGYLAVPYILDAIDNGADAHSVIEALYCIIMYDRQLLGDMLAGKVEVEPVEIHIMFEKVNQWLENSEDKIQLIRAIVESGSNKD